MVKKYNKKLVGILLAAVITVTTVMPMQGKAAEGNVAAAGAQMNIILLGSHQFPA